MSDLVLIVVTVAIVAVIFLTIVAIYLIISNRLRNMYYTIIWIGGK